MVDPSIIQQMHMPIKISRSEHLYINKTYLELLKQNNLFSFDSIWRFSGDQMVKRIKHREIIRFNLQDNYRSHRLFLKRHKREFVGITRFIGKTFGQHAHSQGRIEFENICEFRKHQIMTVVPVAAGERYVSCFWVESFLITADFTPFISLETLIKKEPAVFTTPDKRSYKKRLLYQIAQLARIMHAYGFHHQDFNATHILLCFEPDNAEIPLALFDLQRVEKRKVFKQRWMVKGLARLNQTLPQQLFSEEDRRYLFKSYKSIKRMQLNDHLQWLWIKRKTSRIERHTQKIMALKRNQPYQAGFKSTDRP